MTRPTRRSRRYGTGCNCLLFPWSSHWEEFGLTHSRIVPVARLPWSSRVTRRWIRTWIGCPRCSSTHAPPCAPPLMRTSGQSRARTLAILRRLDGGRKGLVLLFLYDTRLIDRANPVIRLDTADLSDVVFPAGTRGSNLPDIDEGGGVKVSFNGVNLSGANLHGANLTGAHLSRAVLIGADLSGATLHGADLRGVNLGVIPFAPPPDRPPSDPLTNNVANNATDLTNADLSGSFLNETYLVPATLTGKNLNLTGAHLTGAIMSRQQFVDLYPGRPCSHSTCRLPSSGK